MGKRGNGEGSVTRSRGDGWRLRISMVNPMTGEAGRFSRVVHARTKREAVHALQAWQREMAEHLRVDPGEMNVAALVDDWLKHIEGSKAPTTIRHYRSVLMSHVVPRIGTLRVADLTTRTVDALYAAMTQDSCTPATVKSVHTALMSMVRQAMRWGLVEKMPEPTIPRVERPEREVPTPDQIRALVEQADNMTLPHVAVLIRIAAKTGVRRGELCGLRVSDLDWDAGTLTIRRQIQSRLGELPVKGYKPRTVALSAGLREEIQAYLAHERETWQREPGPWLISRDGGLTPLSHWSAGEEIHRVAQKCGIHVTAHSFRHFHSTYGVAAGVDPVTMAKRSGHSVDVAMRTYLHRVDEADVRAAEALESVLRGEVREVLPPT